MQKQSSSHNCRLSSVCVGKLTFCLVALWFPNALFLTKVYGGSRPWTRKIRGRTNNTSMLHASVYSDRQSSPKVSLSWNSFFLFFLVVFLFVSFYFVRQFSLLTIIIIFKNFSLTMFCHKKNFAAGELAHSVK